jgi:hypothetical protein
LKYLFIFLMLSLISCDSGGIYNGKFALKFTVNNSSINRTDTLSLKEGDFWYPKLKWEFSSTEGIATIGTSVEKLFTDNNEIVKISTPYGIYLNQTELVPHPEVHFPINVGDTYESNYKTDSQDNSIDDVDVEGRLKVVGKIMYLPKLLKDSSWVINAEGNSSVGKFTSTYYFHEKYGFVYFKYNLGKDTIEIELNQLSKIEKSTSKVQ